MTTSITANWGVGTSTTGNQTTLLGETVSSTGLGTLTVADMSAKAMELSVIGDVHGMVRIPLADPDDFSGALSPDEMTTGQVILTQGGASGTIGVIVEELYIY